MQWVSKRDPESAPPRRQTHLSNTERNTSNKPRFLAHPFLARVALGADADHNIASVVIGALVGLAAKHLLKALGCPGRDVHGERVLRLHHACSVALSTLARNFLALAAAVGASGAKRQQTATTTSLVHSRHLDIGEHSGEDLVLLHDNAAATAPAALLNVGWRVCS